MRLVDVLDDAKGYSGYCVRLVDNALAKGVGDAAEAGAVSVGTMLQGQGRCTCQSVVLR
jgi:hypothetical protein